MKIIRSPLEMQAIALKLRAKGRSIGLVPTMGALHEGHLSLIKKARAENGTVVVSIFVNPKQFGPKEDYLRYPRPFDKDRALSKKAKADYIFAPSVASMYPVPYHTYINVEKLSDNLCGKYRPGHFRGVATVVAKLFNITLPARAYFGMKDYQQLKIIEKMAKDLNLPVKIVPCPIIREKNGLALSSRNRYLTIEQRAASGDIRKSLQFARDMIKFQKVKSAQKTSKIVRKMISKIPGSKVEYAEVLDAENLNPLKKLKFPLVIAAAVWIGKTRLIDNIIVCSAGR